MLKNSSKKKSKRPNVFDIMSSSGQKRLSTTCICPLLALLAYTSQLLTLLSARDVLVNKRLWKFFT